MSLKIQLLPVILFITIGCNNTSQNLIDPKKTAVLDKIECCSFDSTWHPGEEQINKAFRKIETFLNNPGFKVDFYTKEVEKIRKNIKAYNVQLTGIYIKGKKYICFNFFPTRLLDHSDFNWRKAAVIVMDGGFWFWRVSYDIEQDKCVGFESNGYA